MRRKRESKSENFVAGAMPPLRHKLPGEAFSFERSEVVRWLLNQPLVQQAVFDHYNARGSIIYNAETGTWQGANYAAE